MHNFPNLLSGIHTRLQGYIHVFSLCRWIHLTPTEMLDVCVEVSDGLRICEIMEILSSAGRAQDRRDVARDFVGQWRQHLARCVNL